MANLACLDTSAPLGFIFLLLLGAGAEATLWPPPGPHPC
jgi:hypothetical protein